MIDAGVPRTIGVGSRVGGAIEVEYASARMEAPRPRELVRIHGVAHGGQGVGRGEGEDADPRTWLVDHAIPGDLVVAERIHEGKRMLRGVTLEVTEASPDRVEPPCPVAETCGGCNWQEIAPSAQIELKRRIVDGALRGIGARVDRVVAAPRSLGYRRRARVHYRHLGDTFELGFLRNRSHAVVDIDACPVLEPPLNHALRRLREVHEVLGAEGEVHLLGDGSRVVIGLPGIRPNDEIEAALRSILDETLVGVVLRGGRERVGVGLQSLDVDGGARPPLRAGPFVFTQAQSAQNDVLVDLVIAAAKPRGRRVLELYAGAGNFTRALAALASRVWALEESRESVAHLRALAHAHDLPIDARRGRVEALLTRLEREERGYDVVVLDPPRKGLGGAASALARVARERIVHVSCDPATLARDLATLLGAGAGWSITDVTIVDMMPMTSEVEVVVTLVRAGAESTG